MQKEQDEMEKWETKGGVDFLKRIGITSGMNILDFGARVGHYTIPAAILIGKNGTVIALDMKHESLDELEKKASSTGLDNIRTIRTDGELKLDLQSDTFDMVLVYDVLHYLKSSERKDLYLELYRILKTSSILSIYPKHVKEDWPMDGFEGVGIEDVKKEVQVAGFRFNRKYCGRISHDSSLNQGCVYNFRKM